MKKTVISTLIIIASLNFLSEAQCQITLTFTANNTGEYVQPDSIRIQQLTSGDHLTLVYPDTVYTMVGVTESTETSHQLRLEQNYPNPFNDFTTIRFNTTQSEFVRIFVTDVSGKEVASFSRNLPEGSHSMKFYGGSVNFYFLQILYSQHSESIKMLCVGENDRSCKLEYADQQPSKGMEKSVAYTNEMTNLTDEFLFVVYSNEEESGLTDSPVTSTNYNMQFATKIPCPGNDSVLYEDQWYHTVQIYNQCWFKENLNVGEKINSPEIPTNNGVIEKYCMGDMQSYCDQTGGLYFWGELMQYNYVPGEKGICPDGWHIPTHTEWQILEGAADSEYLIGDPVWDITDFRGMDAGGTLKQVGLQSWMYPNTGATDGLGFCALPGGYYVQFSWWGHGYKGVFYSSDTYHKYVRVLWYDQQDIELGGGGGGLAGSVRCIKD